MRFENISEMPRASMVLPKAEEVPIFSEKESLDKFKGIRNLDTGEVIRIFDKDYTLVQHSEVLEEVSSTLSELGINGSGRIETSNNGARMSAYITFDNKLISDDADGIQPGIKISNSFDGSSSIRLESFAKRLVCNNGMTMSTVFSNQVVMHRHLKKDKFAASQLQPMIKEIIDKDNHIQKLVEKAMSESFAWETLQNFLTKMLEKEIAFKHLSKILDKVGITVMKEKDKKTKQIKYNFIQEKNYTNKKWDLYNAFTNYLSHEAGENYNLKQWLETLSEKVLIAPIMG